MHLLRRAFLVALAVCFTACGPEIPKQLESSFTMAKNSMSFPNFAAGYDDAVLDAEGVRRMFGEQVCKNQSSPCELSVGARAFMNKANKAMAGGRCEGFAVTASLMEAGKVAALPFGGESARDLTLDDNPDLQKEIAYWFATQLHPSVAEKTKGYMAKDVMPKLVEALSKNATERFRIGIVKKQGGTVSGGHAVTPISFYQESDGVYLLRVYDNNLPDFERTMKIDVKNNRWEYEAATNPTKRSSLYFGDDSNKNPLYFAPVISRTGNLPCHFCDGATAQVTSSGGAQVEVNGTGVSDGEVKQEAGSSAAPMFTVDNDLEGTSYIVNTSMNGTLNVKVRPGDDGTSSDSSRSSVSVLGSGFSAEIEGLRLLTEDLLAVAPAGRSVAYTNNSGTPLTLNSVLELGGKIVTVSATVDSSSSQIKTEVDDNGIITFEANDSQGATITVSVTVEAEDGMTKSGTLTFTSNGDASLGTNSQELEMTGTLTGTVNNDGMMMMVTNACVDGQKNGMESDIDCGGTCTDKCSVGQACTAGTDCVSSFCNATTQRCVATSCQDGTKNNAETDIDCGGTLCAACSAGKACQGDTDCAGGFSCVSSVCVASYSLSASVSGLSPPGQLELTNTVNGEVLTVSGNGTVTFAARITAGYNVTVTQQPINAVCNVTGGMGTATGNVTVTVTCVSSYRISGAITGLPSGDSVVLRNNGGDDVTVTQNGSFFFPTRVNGSYAVTIFTQPANASCTVSNGTGTAMGDVSNVTVACSASGFSIGGTLSGLPVGQSVTLTNNGGDATTVMVNGPFTFTTPTTVYDVAVSAQPMGALCSVQNGSGTATGNITNVQVVCSVASSGLDPTFNGTGIYSFAPNALSQEWYRVVVNPDNSMVWVGYNEVTGTDFEWAIAKLTAAGTPDTNFGNNGYLYLGRGTSRSEMAKAIHRNSDGSYLVAGTVFDAGSESFAVAKITAAGALDTTFGNMGWAIHDFASGVEILEDMGVLSDGSIVLVGTDSPGPSSVAIVVKLTAAGSLDTAFAAMGRYDAAVPGASAARAVSIRSPGDDIYVGGYTGAAAAQDAMIISLTATGFENPLFGMGGVVVADLSGVSTADQINDLVIEGDVTVVGSIDNGADSDIVVAQFEGAMGTPTANFGGTGRFVRDNAGAIDQGLSIVYLPSNGGFLVGGATAGDIAVLKFHNSGNLDTTFGTMGQFSSTLGSVTGNLAWDISLDSLGRIVAGGMVSGATSNESFGCIRLNP